MQPGKLIRCASCNGRKPVKDFPPSPMSATGVLPKCMGCVRLAARAQRAQATLSALLPAAVEPSQAPLPPHLVQAAVRFVAEYQPGVERPIDVELEPEFRNLLLWVRYLCVKEAAAPMTPGQIGREIADFRNLRMPDGVSNRALRDALMRAAAIYAQAPSEADSSD
jgi:hypothetical protein